MSGSLKLAISSINLLDGLDYQGIGYQLINDCFRLALVSHTLHLSSSRVEKIHAGVKYALESCTVGCLGRCLRLRLLTTGCAWRSGRSSNGRLLGSSFASWSLCTRSKRESVIAVQADTKNILNNSRIQKRCIVITIERREVGNVSSHGWRVIGSNLDLIILESIRRGFGFPCSAPKMHAWNRSTKDRSRCNCISCGLFLGWSFVLDLLQTGKPWKILHRGSKVYLLHLWRALPAVAALW